MSTIIGQWGIHLAPQQCCEAVFPKRSNYPIQSQYFPPRIVPIYLLYIAPGFQKHICTITADRMNGYWAVPITRSNQSIQDRLYQETYHQNWTLQLHDLERIYFSFLTAGLLSPYPSRCPLFSPFTSPRRPPLLTIRVLSPSASSHRHPPNNCCFQCDPVLYSTTLPLLRMHLARSTSITDVPHRQRAIASFGKIVSFLTKLSERCIRI